jgi:hypothetical protein
MRIVIILFSLIITTAAAKAQSVGVNTSSPEASAALDVSATDKGMLVPRMNTSQRGAIASPANGLLVYDTDTKSFWFREGSSWVELVNSVAAKSVNGSSTFTSVPLNPKKYIWELNAAHPTQNTISIPTSIITDLCGDEDGCKVTMTMVNWAVGETASSSTSFNFFYSAVNGKWRVNEGGVGTTGTDGDGAVATVTVLNSNIYFTDGAYVSGVGTDAAASGFGFMKWTAYPSTTVARLIITD